MFVLILKVANPLLLLGQFHPMDFIILLKINNFKYLWLPYGGYSGFSWGGCSPSAGGGFYPSGFYCSPSWGGGTCSG